MKIAVVSDIHSSLGALEAVLDELESQEYAELLCAGDLVGYNANPNEVIKRLQEHDAVCIRGNHDQATVDFPGGFGFNSLAMQAVEWTRDEIRQDSKEFLEQLPSHRRLEMDGREIYMVHGSPRNPIEEYVYEEQVDEDFLDRQLDDVPDVLVMGHTHVPFVKQVGGTLVLNPGSVGQPRDGDPRASYAMIDLEGMEAEICRVEYDVETAARKTSQQVNPRLGERLKRGR